jgi:hypothetical protein
MFRFFNLKNNHLPLNEILQKYIKENNLKIFNSHILYNKNKIKMKINNLFENDISNNNDYFFYEDYFDDGNEKNKSKKLPIEKTIEENNLSEMEIIINNNNNINQFNDEINTYKIKLIYILSSTSLAVFSLLVSYKYYITMK